MVFGLGNNYDQKARDQQAKFIKQGITKSENLLSDTLCRIQKQCRKTAQLRDTSDAMCKSMQSFSNEETPQLREGISALANALSQVQDYRQACLERMDQKVILPLQTYEQNWRQSKR